MSDSSSPQPQSQHEHKHRHHHHNHVPKPKKTVNESESDVTQPKTVVDEKHEKVVEEAKEQKKQEEEKEIPDATPLHSAARALNISKVQTLLTQNDVDVNAVAPADGRTPLHRACSVSGILRTCSPLSIRSFR